MKVVKDLTFDAAHVLSNYKGKCNNLHGHTYHVHIELFGETQEDGMLVDFNTIKQIIDKYDHAIIFGGEAVREPFEQGLFDLVVTYNKRYCVMPKYMKPTAENMADVIATELKGLAGVKSALVRVWETLTAYAEEFASDER